MTTTTTTAHTDLDTQLAALAAFARSVWLPRGSVIIVNPEGGPNAEVQTGNCVTRSPIVRADLQPEAAETCAAVAHEFGHLRSEHTLIAAASAKDLQDFLIKSAFGFAALAMFGPECARPWGAPGFVLALAGAAVAWLITRALQRRAEYEADAVGVRLLNLIGLPGPEVTIRSLERVRARTRWERFVDRFLWWTGTHPTVDQRIRRIQMMR